MGTICGLGWIPSWLSRRLNSSVLLLPVQRGVRMEGAVLLPVQRGVWTERCCCRAAKLIRQVDPIDRIQPRRRRSPAGRPIDRIQPSAARTCLSPRIQSTSESCGGRVGAGGAARCGAGGGGSGGGRRAVRRGRRWKKGRGRAGGEVGRRRARRSRVSDARAGVRVGGLG
jgi:hypothetical protein